MMLGECLCMVAYLILKYVVYKDTPEVINIFLKIFLYVFKKMQVIDGPDAKPMNPLVLWPVAIEITSELIH